MAEGFRKSTTDNGARIDDAQDRVVALRQFREYLAFLIRASAESKHLELRAPALESAA